MRDRGAPLQTANDAPQEIAARELDPRDCVPGGAAKPTARDCVAWELLVGCRRHDRDVSHRWDRPDRFAAVHRSRFAPFSSPPLSHYMLRG